MTGIDICNEALSSLGIPAITSFNDDSNEARFLKINYPNWRERVLSDHFWSFATVAADLQVLEEKPFDLSFDFLCRLPIDYIRLVELQPRTRCRIAGGNIMVQHHPCRIVYIRNVTNDPELTAPFCEALVCFVASKIAGKISRMPEMANQQLMKYQEALALARSYDSRDNISWEDFVTASLLGPFEGAFVAGKAAQAAADALSPILTGRGGGGFQAGRAFDALPMISEATRGVGNVAKIIHDIIAEDEQPTSAEYYRAIQGMADLVAAAGTFAPIPYAGAGGAMTGAFLREAKRLWNIFAPDKPEKPKYNF